MDAVIKYPGSKASIASWIIGHFPNHRSYLEPFFGGGSVLFSKPRSAIETINDLDGDVVNFFRQVRDNPGPLAEAIYLTPYARREYDRAVDSDPDDPVSQAVDFCIKLMMGHGYRTSGAKVGWKHDVQGREAAYAARDWCQLPSIIREATERLRGVQIENKPALEVIKRYNYSNVLIYADPPYLMETRWGKQYKHEMTERDHIDLLEVLLQHKGPALISGYESDLYSSLLKNWTVETVKTRAQNHSKRKECLWMNFEPNLSLFD